MLKKFFSAYKRVFSHQLYVVLAVLVSFAFYFLNGVIANFRTIKTLFSHFNFVVATGLSVQSVLNSKGFLDSETFVSLMIISVLFGFLVSLLVFKTQVLKGSSDKKFGVLGTLGIFLGVLVPGCAACGVGLASVLGLSAFLVFLPFDGLEISVLSIVLLLFANYKVTKSLLKPNTCNIK